MKRFYIWAWITGGGLVYYATKIGMGYGTIYNSLENLTAAAYWSGVALLAHWLVTRADSTERQS